MSGTTAVSASFHGNSITICNVGDSRAILGHRIYKKDKDDTQLLAIPLSRDQTPYRKDERERVRQSGAAVMSIGKFRICPERIERVEFATRDFCNPRRIRFSP